MAAKAHAVRRANSLAAREARIAQAQPSQTGSALAAGNPTLDAFVSQTLLRVRKQMHRLDRMISDELDPAKLDRLAAAFGRLSEIEQRLADRPLPGSKRPTPEKSSPGRSASLLLGSDPSPSPGQVEQE
jgi:hypothetical protein